MTKLDHINGEYIRALPTESFVDLAEPFVYGVDTDVPWAPDAYRPEVFEMVAADVQQRVATLSDIPRFVDWLFLDEVSYDVDSKGWKKSMIKGKFVPEILDGIAEAFATVEWDAEALNAAVSGVGDTLGARSQVPARIAITGTNAGIPLWDAAATLDRDVVLRRITAARSLLGD